MKNYFAYAFLLIAGLSTQAQAVDVKCLAKSGSFTAATIILPNSSFGACTAKVKPLKDFILANSEFGGSPRYSVKATDNQTRRTMNTSTETLSLKDITASLPLDKNAFSGFGCRVKLIRSSVFGSTSTQVVEKIIDKPDLATFSSDQELVDYIQTEVVAKCGALADQAKKLVCSNYSKSTKFKAKFTVLGTLGRRLVPLLSGAEKVTCDSTTFVEQPTDTGDSAEPSSPDADEF